MPRNVITETELKALCSPSVQKLNPEVFQPLAGLAQSEPEPSAPAKCRRAVPGQEENAAGLEKCNRHPPPLVALTSYRRRLLDGDNLNGGFKALRDEIAAFIGLDDSEQFIDWKYYQLKVDSKSEEGTAVRIKINRKRKR